MKDWMLAVIGLVLSIVAQAGGSAEVLNCTAIGGSNGVGVEIPVSLFVTSGHVDFTVCDATGCETASGRLARFDASVPTPVGRGSNVSFEKLGRSFDPGAVRITATLVGPDGKRVATRTISTTLKRYYPNGKACDGDGYVSGALALRAADRVK